jgi:hypothetical protein
MARDASQHSAIVSLLARVAMMDDPAATQGRLRRRALEL